MKKDQRREKIEPKECAHPIAIMTNSIAQYYIGYNADGYTYFPRKCYYTAFYVCTRVCFFLSLFVEFFKVIAL